MGTGIVSVGLASDRRHTLSLVLLAIAAVVWVGLACVVAGRALGDRPRVRGEARSPAALTGAAATAVLGARATGLGWSGVAIALLIIASGLWLVLLAPVLLGSAPKAAGTAFMATVSTQALAVLAAQLAVREHAVWLLYLAFVLLGLGLALYVFVLARFDFGQLLVGAGDEWVSGGALAISTLAAARITIGVGRFHELAGANGSLQALTLALWALSLAWLPALIITEAVRPRLAYDVRRWATVFPVGMYAACSFDAGRAARVAGLADFARAWVWVGFALWLVVFVAMAWRWPRLVRGGDPDA